MKGKATVIHWKTKTYIKDLGKDDYFGEIAFFSDKVVRQTTVKSWDFTHVLLLKNQEFAQWTENFPFSMHLHYLIKNSIDQNGNYNYLKIKCYICENIGHISIDCPEFKTKEGNLSKYFDKIKDKLDITNENNDSDLGKLTKVIAFDGDAKDKTDGEEGSKKKEG